MFDLFCSSWIVLLPIVAIAGLCFVYVRSLRRSLARWNRLVGLMLVGFLLLPCPVLIGMSLYWDKVVIPKEQKQIKHDSDVIIRNLIQFKTDTGRYPDELSELKPNYLNQIPTAPEGFIYEYKYRPIENEFRFRYLFPYSAGWLGVTNCTYSSEDQTTYCRD